MATPSSTTRYIQVEIGALTTDSSVYVTTEDGYEHELVVVDGPGLQLVASGNPDVSTGDQGLRAIFDHGGRPTLRSGDRLKVGRLGRNGITLLDVHSLSEIIALRINVKRPPGR